MSLNEIASLYRDERTKNIACSNGIRQTNNTMKQVADFIKLKESLGISTIMFETGSNEISAKFRCIDELFKNPDFLTHLSQDIYVSDNNELSWFKVTLKNGKITNITFLLTLKINWIDIYNKQFDEFYVIHVGYSPDAINASIATTVVPYSAFVPGKIEKYFPQLIGKFNNQNKDVGKIICYILTKHIKSRGNVNLKYIGEKQGFVKCIDGRTRFCSSYMFRDEVAKYVDKSLISRKYPICYVNLDQDITQKLKPLFENQKEFQLLLLYRMASWFQSFFAKLDVYSDNILIVKPTSKIPVTLLVAILKNTNYESLDAPSIGPNVTPLKVDLENVNDGMVVSIDVYAGDQVEKASKGYNLMINDAAGAKNNSNGVYHISTLISRYADLYFPKEQCCVLEFKDAAINYMPHNFKDALRIFDANIVMRVERECGNGSFIEVFTSLVKEAKRGMPYALPRSKYFTYIMLMTAFRMYNEWYTPMFSPDIEQYIEEWLCSQEQDSQPLHDTICSEYGKILNQKIADGYFRLVAKEEVTPYDKGTHTVVINKVKRCIYVEPADSFYIAKNEMSSVTNTDSLTAALYNSGYLPFNARNDKSVRIAAVTSDGTPYPLYVHAISYKLLTQENKLKFELLDKDANLFKYEEIPREDFLPLIKTVDGRYAGKKLRYEAEEANVYLGTGRIGSGKSWAIAQLLPMLFMLGHTIVIFEVSNSFTKEELLNMLPVEVVEKLFKFINLGVEKDPVPIDLGSLSGYDSLPEKKQAIYSVIRAAAGFLDKTPARKLKGFLSDYLRDKGNSIDLNDLCSELEEAPGFGAEIADSIESVLDDIKEIGFDKQTWDDLFSDERKIIVLNLGNEVGDSTHQLLDMLAGSLFTWQMSHDTGFLSIAIDEVADQDFSKGSPLSTIVKQGRKFHTALIGATQDYFNQGSSYLDTMKQANIKSFCRPGKSEDHVAQKLGYRDAIDAGFNKFKAGDTILEFDGYNKETGENEALTMKGRVVNFVETPLYEKFKEIYGCY